MTGATIITLSLVSLTLAASAYIISKQLARTTNAELESETAQGRLRCERRARTPSPPKIRRLVDQEKFAQALALAIEAERQIPDDPMSGEMWPEFSVESSITTDPSGVAVAIREWNATGDKW